MKRAAAALVLLAGLLAAPGARGEACDVLDFGARGDGVTLDTAAFRAALASCQERGGGTVSVAPGRYVIGALELPSHTALSLAAGATLLGSLDPEDYPLVETRWEGRSVRGHAALLSARGARDVAILGEGVVDGRGAGWWKRARAGDLEHPRPRLVELAGVHGARVSGVTLRNSPSWTLHLLYSEDVVVSGIRIESPPEAPNTDGIDVDSSRDVRISDCRIDVGDDCIALKSGRDEDGRRVGRPTENVTISNCVLRRGHGAVVVGSETSGDVRGVVVSNSVFDGTDRGLRVKTRRGRGGVVEDVLVSNVVMRDVPTPLMLNLFYQGDGGEIPEDATPGPGTPTVRGIHLQQVVARGADRAAWIRGLPERPLEDVSLRGVRIEAREGVYAKDVRRLTLEGLDLTVAEGLGVRARRVEDLELIRVRGLGAPDGDAWIELVDVRGALLQELVAPRTPLLLRVLGDASAEIALQGGRLGEARRLVSLGDGARAAAVVRGADSPAAAAR